MIGRSMLCLTRPIVSAALVAAFGLLMPATSLGQEFCSEPVLPYCVDQFSDFDSTQQVDRCDDDLEEFKTKLKEYESCIDRQIKSLRGELKEARKRLEDVRKNFENYSVPSDE